MSKRFLSAILVIAVVLTAAVVLFYVVTASKKQEPVRVYAPVSTPANPQ
jgi:hypothetical protein